MTLRREQFVEHWDMMEAYKDGENIEVQAPTLDDYWIYTRTPNWLKGRKYRIAKTQMTVPWDILISDIQWVFKDNQGKVYGSIEKPLMDNLEYSADYRMVIPIWLLKGFNAGTCNWSDSLIQRPQKENT